MLENLILPGIPLPLFWILIAAAIVIQGIGKSGFAGGAGILSLPLMMLVMPVEKVVATLLPILILCDVNAIYHYRNDRDWSLIRRLYVPALVGIVLGCALWGWMGQAGIEPYAVPLKRFVGVIAILFGLYIGAKETSMRWIARHRPGPRAAWPVGIAAGFTSTLVHAAGPIVSLYVFAQGLGKTLFVGTVAWTFTLINLSKLPFYTYIGLIDAQVVLFDLWLIPLVPLGAYLGKWMHNRVNEKSFNRIIMILTLIAGIQLVLNINIIHGTITALTQN